MGRDTPTTPLPQDVSGDGSTPPPDLMRERDEVLNSLSRGARLTEHFVSEYSRMHQRLAQLETDNAKLRAQLAADDAMARLLAQVEKLETERQQLLSRTIEAEKAQHQFDERVVEAEGEFASLANLFVASNQLHASLSPRGVIRRIKEILAQLVGAESYAMYMSSADGKQLIPIASEGVPGSKLVSVAMEGSKMGEVVAAGKAQIDEERPSNSLDLENPAVLVPLIVDETAVGAIAIFATLAQKPRFCQTDFELFQLLGQHAASALVGASLFDKAGRRLPGADAFRDLSV